MISAWSPPGRCSISAERRSREDGHTLGAGATPQTRMGLSPDFIERQEIGRAAHPCCHRNQRHTGSGSAASSPVGDRCQPGTWQAGCGPAGRDALIAESGECRAPDLCIDRWIGAPQDPMSDPELVGGARPEELLPCEAPALG